MTRDAGGPVVWILRALVCLAPFVVLRLVLSPVLGGSGGATVLLPALLIVTLWSSWRAGAVATVLALAASSAASLIPGVLEFTWTRFWVGTGLFLVNAVFIVAMGQALRASIKGADADHQSVQSQAAIVAESEARFRSIADSAPVLVWVTQLDRRRAFVNQAYVEFVGGDYDTARNLDWRDVLHPDDLDRIVRESIAGESAREPFMLEGRYRHHSGDYRWLRSYSRPRFDLKGDLAGFVGVAYDVTAAKQVERDLTHINELLEGRVAEALKEKEQAEQALMHAQKMEAVGRLTGGVAHDFNNLLTVVIGALDMVVRNPDDTRRRDKMLDAALKAARRGETLTHQLLAFSRRQALRPQLCDANELLRDGEPLLRRAVGEATELTLELENAPPAVSLDPAHFEAAILNLVVNARDATPDGGRIGISTERVTLTDGEVSGASAGDYLEVSVSDTGSGMSPEVMERAFEPFFTTKPIGKGTGLGLSQVYGFVRQSGGAMTVDSAPGGGTRFSLYLPVMAEAAPVAAVRPETYPAEGRPFADKSVLLVEDDAEVSDVAAAMLEDMGLSVTRAADGPSALRAVEKESFDLLVTDIVMPGGLNGAEVARQVTEKRPEMAVLLASGYAGEALEKVTAGVPWPLLSKPYDADEMRQAIQSAFSG